MVAPGGRSPSRPRRTGGERLPFPLSAGGERFFTLGYSYVDGWTEPEQVDPAADVDLLGEDEQPERGRRYAVPLNIHCGMDWLYVGGRPRQRSDDEPDVETGSGDAVPDGWPVARETIFGYATLVGDDLIEYSIGDGEIIATYAPATEDPPGCA